MTKLFFGRKKKFSETSQVARNKHAHAESHRFSKKKFLTSPTFSPIGGKNSTPANGTVLGGIKVSRQTGSFRAIL
jgi:hypothetical protein